MADSSIKFAGFLGAMPKISPELLPAMSAQIAKNCKLYSGDLIPYPAPVVVDNTERSGTIRSLYALRDPATSALKWLSWTTSVDVVQLPTTGDTSQRFYYTGDGVPKVSDYVLATTGSEPYPVDYYELGLPLPTQVPTTSYTAFTTKTISTIARSADNVATITTSTAHGLRTGALINVSGYGFKTGTYTQIAYTTTIIVSITAHGLSNGDFVSLEFLSGNAFSNTFAITLISANSFSVESYYADPSGTSGDVRFGVGDFNVSSVACTVTSPTSLTYPNTGPTLSTTSLTGSLSLAGGSTSQRNYLYTWVTPWGEESIGSSPSADIYVRDGENVTVVNLPIAKPSGKNFIRGINLYRLIPSASGSNFFKMKTLWFPNNLVSVRRLSNVATIKTLYPHNLVVGDKLRISNCALASFDIATAKVVSVVDEYSFTFQQFDSDVALTAELSGILYYDMAQNLTKSASYSQSGTTITVTATNHGYTTADNVYLDITSGTARSGLYSVTVTGTNTFTVTSAVSVTTSGSVTLTTHRFWGTPTYDFTDDYNPLYVIDPYLSGNYEKPPADLTGLKVVQNNILAGFSGKTLYFSDPAKPFSWPSSYAINVEYDIVAIEPVAGRLLVLTKGFPSLVDGTDPSVMTVSRVDVLHPCLNKDSVVSMPYGVVYSTHDGLASYSPGSGLSIITQAVHDADTWSASVDPSTVLGAFYGNAYFATHSTGSFVFEQDQQTGGYFVDTTYSFSSDWYDTQTNKLYYVFGTNGDIYEWDRLSQPASTMEWKSKVIITADHINIGAGKVVADYTNLTSTWDSVLTLWESTPQLWNNADQITFKFWADKQLTSTVTLNENRIFRLPTGYRTDTYEFSVEGNVRVRAVYLGETPTSLKGI
jgi:hypothetical protein